MQYKANCEIKPGMSVPEGMRRYALGVEYNGSNYQGFQRQISAKRTVQAELEKALSLVANEPVTLVCAGRTDAGVHATQQVIHFDSLAVRPDRAWVKGGNTNLPNDIKVKWAREVSFDFHARFCATARTYRYVIYPSDCRPALMYDQVTWCKYQLDRELMFQGAQFLLGEHDFTSYRAVQCQAKNPVRHIQHIKISPQGELIVVEVKANAFLHHMIRNIIGVLFEVGRGAKPPVWVKEVLEAKDRTAAAATAPPFGLYFVDVGYPVEFNLPPSPLGPIFLPG